MRTESGLNVLEELKAIQPIKELDINYLEY